MSNIQPTEITTDKDLFVKMALSNWELQISRMNSLLVKLTDEELSTQTAPDRNTGVYILGHLAAVSDALLTQLGLGERINPALDDIFLRNPENSGLARPSLGELKEYWNHVNMVLAEKFSQMSAEDWFSRHTAVSAEDFAKEPHRNKLNMILNRTTHMGYHIGQLVYLIRK